MAGIIIGAFGYQRSGKTLLAYLLANHFYNCGMDVFTNMDVPHFNTISALTDLPFDNNQKVLLLDECYYFLDSRNWKNNTDSSIFFNTIGKQNILLLITSVDPDTVELRIRNQMNYVFLVKSDKDFIYYKIIDVQRNKHNVFTLKKSQEFFDTLKYDTNQVPGYVDCSLKDFRQKVNAFNNNKNNLSVKRSVEL
jgi:hypothetical protein